MAPGKRTLFLNGRIPSRAGSSTDSAMFAIQEKEGKAKKFRERERESEEEEEEEEEDKQGPGNGFFRTVG